MSNKVSIYVTVEIDGETFQIDKGHIPPSLIEEAQAQGIELADMVKAAMQVAYDTYKDFHDEFFELARKKQSQEMDGLNGMLGDIDINLSPLT